MPSQGPKSALIPHTGPNNKRLTAHLGLIIPNGTRLDVGHDSKRWEEGKVLVFDDAFSAQLYVAHNIVGCVFWFKLLLILFVYLKNSSSTRCDERSPH